MYVKIRFELDKRRFQESFDRYIDRVHETFRDQMLETLGSSGPIETGEMRASWQYQRRSKHHSVVFNDTPQAAFLQGTGIWGPRGQLICARKAKALRFYWRYFGYEPFYRKCVKGINPHEVHGMAGQVYDFIDMMNTAIRKGWDNTVKEI